MNTDGTPGDAKPRRRRRWYWYPAICVLVLCVWQVTAWLAPVPAPLASAAAVTDQVYEAVYDEAITERAAKLPGEVNILLVGLDNRLASTDNHADAIHLISVRTKDSVGVTITSIPRGTEVKGYGIQEDLSFMANVRALKGRKTFMKAVAQLTRKKKIDYYVEVTFSQVMGVLELLGYKDPATALQFLRHRKTYALGDVQRSYNQGKFIRQQAIRRGDLLTGAKGDILIRMGLGMVDTDLDMETAQALVYLLKKNDALVESRIDVTMKPKINLASLEKEGAIPEPEEVAGVVNKLVRRTGDQIDDLGRYNPYPRLKELVGRAEAQKNPKAVLATLGTMYTQKAWLQIQERPARREIRDRVEDILIKAYTEMKKPEKADEVRKYMAEERKAFAEAEREQRSFSYGRRSVPARREKLNPEAAARSKRDEIGQKQTRIEPQPTTTAPVEPAETPAVHSQPHEETPLQLGPRRDEVQEKKSAPSEEPQVRDINDGGGK